MAGADRPTGGELNAAITRALVGIHNEYLGRGPSSASTFHHGNVVVTLMYDVLTRAERVIGASSGGSEHVASTRHLYQQAMEGDFVAAIERLTGKTVTAFISGNHIDPDIASEVFVLDDPV